MRGRKVLALPSGSGSTRVPPFSPGAAEEGKYLLQPSGVRGLLGRKLVDAVACPPGRNLRGEIPRGPRGTGTPRLPRVSGRGHGLTVATPCPLPLAPCPSSSLFLSFPASSFFLARADRHASGTPATLGQLLTSAGALFCPLVSPRYLNSAS